MTATYTLPGETGPWEIVVGMEVHAQVISESKLFSGAATAFGAEPNAQVGLVDAAMPGMLPVINAECVRQAVRTGLALGAAINNFSVFDRKQYFYADLPQGYQISQYQQPIVGEGAVDIDLDDGETKTIGIERLHLEQDAGKSIHDLDPRRSFIDLNRAGVALMEIVSKPDIRSPDEAAAYLTKMRAILRTIGTCDGEMQEGSMRADVNVSVRKAGDPFGTRCEIKNVNSIRFVRQAIEIEARRQIEILEEGGTIDQETRLFDPQKGETRAMRSKEEAHDYRYFPDPDLPPLVFDDAFVDDLRAHLPELPDAKKTRFVADYGLRAYEAGVLTAETETAAFFEAMLTKSGRDPKASANAIVTDLFGALNKRGLSIAESPIDADALGELVDLQADGTLSGRLAKDVFEKMLETGDRAGVIVERDGLRQVADAGALQPIIDQILADNADKVAQYRGGKEKLFGFFVGQAMKATGGKAAPGVVNDLLKTALDAG